MKNGTLYQCDQGRHPEEKLVTATREKTEWAMVSDQVVIGLIANANKRSTFPLKSAGKDQPIV